LKAAAALKDGLEIIENSHNIKTPMVKFNSLSIQIYPVDKEKYSSYSTENAKRLK
jgi:hypothetical protein